MLGMDGFFIDKLNVCQDHSLDSPLPLVGKDGLWRFDLETGIFSNEPYVSHLKLEGSYSTSLTIRCNGSRVEVYGNPSRYNRIDNLFGLTTLDDCIQVYNEVLAKLGLPPFTKCTKYLYYQNGEHSKVNKTADGAIIKHIDFTRNLAVGQGNEQAFIRGLASQSVGKSIKPYLYPDQNTVDWFGRSMASNGSTFRYIKVYAKLVDMLRHSKKIIAQSDLCDGAYYESLMDYVRIQGVAREEHSFKRPFLKRYGLFAYGLFDQTEFLKELGIISNLRQRISVNNMKYQTITEQLLEQNICTNTQSANSTQCFYSLWLHGEPLDKTKRQYRVHKARLLQLGIDVTVPLDISHTPIRLKEAQIIEVRPLAMPDWYRQAKAPSHLSLVA